MKHIKLFENWVKDPEFVPVHDEMQIVGTIKRSEINVDKTEFNKEVPKDAEYASLNSTEAFIQQFFRFKKIEFNDGTYRDILQFYTEQGSWHNSSFNVNRKGLATQKFLKIVD